MLAFKSFIYQFSVECLHENSFGSFSKNHIYSAPSRSKPLAITTCSKSDSHVSEKKGNSSQETDQLPLPSKSPFPSQLKKLWLDNTESRDSGSEYFTNVTQKDKTQELDALVQSTVVVEFKGNLPEPSGMPKSKEIDSEVSQGWVDSMLRRNWGRHMTGFQSLWNGFVQYLKIVDQQAAVSPLAVPLLQMFVKEQKKVVNKRVGQQEAPAENLKAIRGSSSCRACGACSAQMATSGKPNCGDSPLNGKGKHTENSIRPFFHAVDSSELEKLTLLSTLSDLAYTIPSINKETLQEKHRLSFVTSSLKLEREKPLQKKVKKDLGSGPILRLPAPPSPSDPNEQTTQNPSCKELSSSVERRGGEASGSALEVVSRESEKDLEKASSDPECPCDWFICDDKDTNTRYIVIQGSDSLASWQTNVAFDPVFFEDPSLGVVVHRGIYDAAKALLRTLDPLIFDFLLKNGPNASLQFTGHSLGGSLATLLVMMLRVQGRLGVESLLPIYTFGAPSILCGGDHLLELLGHPIGFLRQVMMHRDIVPRAFACDYPDHVAEVLRRVNGVFKDHPCLMHQRLMYSPMGTTIVLQPEESQSPHHPLLPAGAALLEIKHPMPALADLPDHSARCRAEIRSAQRAILNNPHPLEILADPGSYGSEGFISRDHDPRNYARAIASLATRESKRVQMAQSQQRTQWEPTGLADLALCHLQSEYSGRHNMAAVRKVMTVNRSQQSLRLRTMGGPRPRKVDHLVERARAGFGTDGSRVFVGESEFSSSWRVRSNRNVVASQHF